MKVAVLFDRFGPYHVAKLNAASAFVSVIPIELFGESSEYKWNKVKGPENRITVFPDRSREAVSAVQLFLTLQKVLHRHKPDVVAINGWSDRGALSALYWCLKNNVPAIIMSDSTAIDEKRVCYKEYIKKIVVRQCRSGLVAGSRHIQYLNLLGMPVDAIFTGYDVIDNQYFQSKVLHIKTNETDAKKKLGLPDNYFLACSRFVPKKNLSFLIKAYAAYRQQSTETPYDLVVLGDGALRDNLVALIDQLGIQHAVHLSGFKQYSELPYYYAFARVFIHASTSEQWGLVVNEAMAAGLPVVVSERCGCVPELVQNGFNGFSFDPSDETALTSILKTISGKGCNLELMGSGSQQTITAWQPDHFGKGLQKAAAKAITESQKSASIFDRIILRSLIFR